MAEGQRETGQVRVRWASQHRVAAEAGEEGEEASAVEEEAIVSVAKDEAGVETFDLEAEIRAALDALDDARTAAFIARFLEEKILPPIRERWMTVYRKTVPELPCHLAMQQRFAAMEELREGLHAVANSLPEEQHNLENLRVVAAEQGRGRDDFPLGEDDE